MLDRILHPMLDPMLDPILGPHVGPQFWNPFAYENIQKTIGKDAMFGVPGQKIRPQINQKMAPKTSQQVPKTAQEAPKIAQEAPKTAQKAPRTAQDTSWGLLGRFGDGFKASKPETYIFPRFLRGLGPNLGARNPPPTGPQTDPQNPVPARKKRSKRKNYPSDRPQLQSA